MKYAEIILVVAPKQISPLSSLYLLSMKVLNIFFSELFWISQNFHFILVYQAVFVLIAFIQVMQMYVQSWWWRKVGNLKKKKKKKPFVKIDSWREMWSFVHKTQLWGILLASPELNIFNSVDS